MTTKEQRENQEFDAGVRLGQRMYHEAHLGTEARSHPYCPDEDGRCQYGRDENCPGIERAEKP